MKIKTKLLISLISLLFILLSILVMFIYNKSSKEMQSVGLSYLNELSNSSSKDIKLEIEKALEIAITTEKAVQALRVSQGKEIKRSDIDAILTNVLRNSEKFLIGAWTCWEPNAFDGLDEKFKNSPNHDATGRYIPYYYKDGSSVKSEPLIDYDKSGAGDYYQLPKRLKRAVVLEPYVYSVGGVDTMITSISIPVFINTEFKGVVGIDIDLSKFSEIVKSIKPYGGYSYLVSNSTAIIAHPSTKVISKKLEDFPKVNPQEFIDSIKESKNLRLEKIAYQDKKVHFIVLKAIQFKGLEETWSFVISAPKENVLRKSKELGLDLVMMGAIFILLMTVLILIMSTFLLKPLTSLAETTKELSEGDGDLTKRLKIDTKDEIADASHGVNNFIARVEGIISDVKKMASDTASVANEVSTTALQIGDRVEDESKIVKETVTDGVSMQSILDESSKKVQDTQSYIKDANENLDQARGYILKMIEDVHKTSESESELSEKLDVLSKDAEQVKGVLTVINDIADQTNLLALNAAIEAARAGEHGRGFAVVADEVRQLAERTQKSLTEINSTISVIVQSIMDTSERMNENSQTVNELSQMSTEVEYKINNTAEIMQKTIVVSEESVKDMLRVIDDVKNMIGKVENISSLAQSNTDSVKETTEAIAHLHKMMEKLSFSLNQFKTS